MIIKVKVSDLLVSGKTVEVANDSDVDRQGGTTFRDRNGSDM